MTDMTFVMNHKNINKTIYNKTVKISKTTKFVTKIMFL